jgi:hypothetical protein
MESQARYRHELKYYINYADYLAIRMRLKAVMHSDQHVRPDGKYLIRSIYFDNYRDKTLKEKVSGVSKREKFRIRYYNDDLSFITLEKKMKVDSLCMKFDTPMTEKECRSLIAGDTSWMMKRDDPLIQEFYAKIKIDLLRPRVLVSYVREPYIYGPGNVRVTFDSEIRSSLYSNNFLDSPDTDIEVTDEPAHFIFEVKYDDYIPDIIADMIQTDSNRVTAFSKYGACRRFG